MGLLNKINKLICVIIVILIITEVIMTTTVNTFAGVDFHEPETVVYDNGSINDTLSDKVEAVAKSLISDLSDTSTDDSSSTTDMSNDTAEEASQGAPTDLHQFLVVRYSLRH
jgi:hypothetical protein